ncbi:MAG: NAD(P)/FAD-dependent oxidoreductase [Anaerolineales bacterium]|nr:NAD(P)/FAD-dependent oxidoreductase [Anaerolineales bacterium]MDW8160660.1 FAD/NAD(P)-binding oxidoreductase [Anaerolineales bacterium]
MKTLLILGAGTGGTMVANKMAKQLDPQEWRIIVVDRDEAHHYQPGYLFIPFGIYTQRDVVKPKRNFLPPTVEVIFSEVEVIEPEKNRVLLRKGNQALNYDYLVIATGSDIHPEEIEGMVDGGWNKNIFTFYNLEGAVKLADFLKHWKGGRLVVNIAEMPIKCPVAPLEFLFLADWFFTERGMRDKVELVFTTPLSEVFTKPRAAKTLGGMLEAKGIHAVTDFNIMEVDNAKQVIRSYDEIEVEYDLLISIPTNKGDEVIQRSQMGDELNYVPTEKHTLRSRDWENIFVIGDASNVPTSKAGSVAHYMADVLVENLLRSIEGLELLPKYDGHANCFIESGFNKGLLIDFNYEVEPLPGKFPLPGFGPFSLLKESHANHWGKMMFRWIYWNVLLKGSETPFESQMSMAGKWV